MAQQLDAGIITQGLQRIQPITPQEAFAQQLKLRAMQQQIDTGDALEQQRRQTLATQQKTTADQASYDRIIGQGWKRGEDGDWEADPDVVMPLLQQNLPHFIPSFMTAQQAAKDKRVTARKSAADAQSAMAKASAERADVLAAGLASVAASGNNPGYFDLVVSQHEKNFPDDAPILAQLRELAKQDVKQAVTAGLQRSKEQRELADKDAARNKPMSVDPTHDLINPADGSVIRPGVPKPPTAKALQQKEVLLDGKPAIVNFNPEDGRSRDAAGTDVTARVRPIPPASTLEKPVDQNKLEQEYRTVLARAMSSRSGGIGLEDSKVQQANHLLGMLDQFHDPKTGETNIPRVQLNELALGLARLTAPNGQAGIQMLNEFNQRTAKGDVAGALTYLTGQPVSANTQAITKMLKDSIERQGQIAEENREGEMRYLRGLAPTTLEESRRQALEANSLNPLRKSRVIQNQQTGERKTQTSTDGGKTWK